jgi:hypothetical protein
MWKLDFLIWRFFCLDIVEYAIKTDIKSLEEILDMSNLTGVCFEEYERIISYMNKMHDSLFKPGLELFKQHEKTNIMSSFWTDKALQECLICYSNDANVKLNGCLHQMCLRCLLSLSKRKCPFCRVRIHEFSNSFEHWTCSNALLKTKCHCFTHKNKIFETWLFHHFYHWLVLICHQWFVHFYQVFFSNLSCDLISSI